VLAYCASSSDVCPLHWGDTAPPPSAELLEEEYWGEEVESYFARWAEVGEALMAQEGARATTRGTCTPFHSHRLGQKL